ncbi:MULTISPECIES: hypothetical protein [Flammeovirga]|uniref:Outer membrane protein beta-barrel domain-containing protein n=1 Tax=Flammeovirga agarivorans TaxID=2726742 RepID=A0A7X8XXZ1_9BACT|nr:MULTISPECIES: hypothetical protein [Flammeovirga]NLR93530.1 hypothetical protein [Flammeovirga agarivorans]
MKTKLLLLSALLFSSMVSFAQDMPYDHYGEKFAIGVSGGSHGIGIDVSKNLHKHFNGSLGFNYFKINDFSRSITVDGKQLKSTVDVEMVNVDLRIEYLPFKGSSFKVVAGLAYMMSSGVKLLGVYENSVTFGELTIDPEDIGELKFDAEWKQVSPYFGIGIGRAVPKKRVGFGLDIGTYYLGKPNVQLTGTELLSAMGTQEAQLQSNMEEYTWFPQLKLRLAVRLN